MLAARLIRVVPLFRIFHSLNAEKDSAEISLVRSGHYVQTASAGLRRRGLRPFAPLGLKPQTPRIYLTKFALSIFAVRAGEVKAKERREGGAGFSLPACDV